MKTDYRPILIVLLLLYAVFSGGGGGPFAPSVDSLLYVYDRDVAPVPDGIEGAVQAINADPNLGIVAMIAEKDQPVSERWADLKATAIADGIPRTVLGGEGKAVSSHETAGYDDTMELVK